MENCGALMELIGASCYIHLNSVRTDISIFVWHEMAIEENIDMGLI